MNFDLNVHSHCVTLCHWAAQAAIVASDESMDVKGAAVPLVIIADPAMTVEQSSQWVVDNQPGIEGLLKVRWMGPFLLGSPAVILHHPRRLHPLSVTPPPSRRASEFHVVHCARTKYPCDVCCVCGSVHHGAPGVFALRRRFDHPVTPPFLLWSNESAAGWVGLTRCTELFSSGGSHSHRSNISMGLSQRFKAGKTCRTKTRCPLLCGFENRDESVRRTKAERVGSCSTTNRSVQGPLGQRPIPPLPWNECFGRDLTPPAHYMYTVAASLQQAQSPRWPSKLFFCCEKAAEAGDGGFTGVCRSDLVLEQLAAKHPEFVAKCEALGVK
jgi:hypothetical protein